MRPLYRRMAVGWMAVATGMVTIIAGTGPVHAQSIEPAPVVQEASVDGADAGTMHHLTYHPSLAWSSGGRQFTTSGATMAGCSTGVQAVCTSWDSNYQSYRRNTTSVLRARASAAFKFGGITLSVSVPPGVGGSVQGTSCVFDSLWVNNPSVWVDHGSGDTCRATSWVAAWRDGMSVTGWHDLGGGNIQSRSAST